MRLFSAMAEKVPIVVILGATGAGKSQLALELAQRFGGEIVSADAMQMYKGLNIITNKVTAEEQRLVKHHMIDILETNSVNTIVDFKNKALPIVEDLLRNGKIPFICGGTNYYIESLIWKILIDEETPYFVDKKRKGELDGNDAESKKLKNNVSEYNNDKPVDPDELNLDEIDFEKDTETIPTDKLFRSLQKIDPDRTDKLHPRERRKIWRSLQIWKHHGVRHSELMSSQGGVKGGGLRFPASRICIIEVWSDQAVLDERCNRRVEKMIERGMVNELISFHDQYNKTRFDISGPDYSQGIFQSIGFKEFHAYLNLDPEQRDSEQGRTEFSKGVQLLKTATRQYARRQAKWMKKRFLLEHRESPAVYRVDSTDPAQWDEKCYKPAERILQAFIEGTEPDLAPLARLTINPEQMDDNMRILHCDLCQRDFTGSHQFKNHLNGKKHAAVLKTIAAAEPPLSLVLVKIDESRKVETAKILKNTFEIPLHEVLARLERIPCEITRLKPRTRAENIKKCLAKHGIHLEIEQTKIID